MSTIRRRIPDSPFPSTLSDRLCAAAQATIPHPFPTAVPHNAHSVKCADECLMNRESERRRVMASLLLYTAARAVEIRRRPSRNEHSFPIPPHTPAAGVPQGTPVVVCPEVSPPVLPLTSPASWC